MPIDSVEAGELIGRSMASNVRVFSVLLKETAEACNLELRWGKVPRPEVAILMSLPAVKFPWPASVAEKVSSFLWRFLHGRPLRAARDLARSF